MPYSPRRSLLLLAHAAVLIAAPAASALPHPFAWAAFGLTGVGR
jgi:hypothetical protein